MGRSKPEKAIVMKRTKRYADYLSDDKKKRQVSQDEQGAKKGTTKLVSKEDFESIYKMNNGLIDLLQEANDDLWEYKQKYESAQSTIRGLQKKLKGVVNADDMSVTELLAYSRKRVSEVVRNKLSRNSD